MTYSHTLSCVCVPSLSLPLPAARLHSAGVQNEDPLCENMMYDEPNERKNGTLSMRASACALTVDTVTVTDIVDYDCSNNIIVYY